MVKNEASCHDERLFVGHGYIASHLERRQGWLKPYRSHETIDDDIHAIELDERTQPIFAAEDLTVRQCRLYSLSILRHGDTDGLGPPKFSQLDQALDSPTGTQCNYVE